jgi:phosphoribosylamine---glycine ligase
MRVLVIGNGAREHAICWKLKQSPLVSELYAAPGNAGIASIANCVRIGQADVIELADFAEKLQIDLTVVGPELPLTLGIVDEFQKRDLTIFGPTRRAAELEGSKVFSKEFMRKYQIPTAEARSCGSLEEGRAMLKSLSFPQVLKVDGLAGGKGVVIARDREEAEEFLRVLFEERRFGNAADRVLIEEFLEGDEVSFMALSDGRRVVPLVPAKDYKRALEGEQGPNTGGMGAHSPSVVLSGEQAAEIMRSIVIPTIQGMEQEGRTYTGCLFVGLMLTASGPKVLEYNCRFGDPETQVQMLRMEDDFADLALQVARGQLTTTKLTWRKEAAACVVVTAEGYPDEFARGAEITADPVDGETMFHFYAGADRRNGNVVVSGGRVISACGRAASLTEAIRLAYEAADRIRFDGARMRRDIGRSALEMLRASSSAEPAAALPNS